MSRPRQPAASAVFVALLAAALQAAPLVACADEATDIQRLVNGGRTAEALARVERALADKPADAQLRFLHGVLLADAKRGDEAMAVFVKLTQDYPELAEPYNNLAVLYAERGSYDKAREALETALRNQPGYATAHENLGDVYARLAAASYARARRLDTRNRSAEGKLAVLRTLFAAQAGNTAASAASAAAAAR